MPFGSVQLAATALGAAVVLVDDVVVAWVVVAALVDELVVAGAAAEVVDDADDDDFLELPPQPASSPRAATRATSAPKSCPRVNRPETLIGRT